MSSLSRETQGLFAINIAAMLFGTAALYGKMDVSPFWIVAMRAAFACITLYAIGVARRQIKKPNKKQCFSLIFTGAVLAVHWLTFFISVQMSGVAIATLTFATFPMFTILIESLRHKKIPQAIELAASAVIIAAVGLLVHIDTSHASRVAWGAASGLISGVTFAWFGISSKKLGSQLPTLTVSFCQNLIVALLLLPTLPFAPPFPSGAREWIGLMLLGVLTTALMHQLYFYALQRLSAGTCSGFIALEPVYAIVFAALFFSEPITLLVITSGILIIGASFLLLKHERKIAALDAPSS